MDLRDNGELGEGGLEQRRPVVPMPGTARSGAVDSVAKSGVKKRGARSPPSQEAKVFRNHH